MEGNIGNASVSLASDRCLWPDPLCGYLMRVQARLDASYFICNLSESARADRDANGQLSSARLGSALQRLIQLEMGSLKLQAFMLYLI